MPRQIMASIVRDLHQRLTALLEALPSTATAHATRVAPFRAADTALARNNVRGHDEKGDRTDVVRQQSPQRRGCTVDLPSTRVDPR